MIPERRTTCHLHRALAVPIPGDDQALPCRLRVGQPLGKGRLPFALQAGSPHGGGQARRSRSIERGIQAQAGNHGNRLAQARAARQQVQRRIAAVGHDDDLALRQPATQLEQQLPCPVDQRFRGSSLLLIRPLQKKDDPFKGSRQGEWRQNTFRDQEGGRGVAPKDPFLWQ